MYIHILIDWFAVKFFSVLSAHAFALIHAHTFIMLMYKQFFKIHQSKLYAHSYTIDIVAIDCSLFYALAGMCVRVCVYVFVYNFQSTQLLKMTDRFNLV